FDVVEEVALPDVRGDPQHPWLLEVGIARQFGRFSLAQIGEDQPQVFPHRVALDPDPLAERLRLRRLLDTLPIGPIDPAVVEAAQVVPFYPASRELRP